ncbi:hypothetical protein J4Q44_G00193070 [Coregonus suidteri]|uniref:ZZ-type zinc finger-containing protein 3 n=1 Tax=Coregonus suidteri TaxID=861788 RepID=A0AAN8LFB3_9TELE
MSGRSWTTLCAAHDSRKSGDPILQQRTEQHHETPVVPPRSMATSRSSRVTRSSVGLNGLDENFCGRTLRNRSIAQPEEGQGSPLPGSRAPRSPKKRQDPQAGSSETPVGHQGKKLNKEEEEEEEEEDSGGHIESDGHGQQPLNSTSCNPPVPPQNSNSHKSCTGLGQTSSSPDAQTNSLGPSTATSTTCSGPGPALLNGSQRGAPCLSPSDPIVPSRNSDPGQEEEVTDSGELPAPPLASFEEDSSTPHLSVREEEVELDVVGDSVCREEEVTATEEEEEEEEEESSSGGSNGWHPTPLVQDAVATSINNINNNINNSGDSTMPLLAPPTPSDPPCTPSVSGTSPPSFTESHEHRYTLRTSPRRAAFGGGKAGAPSSPKPCSPPRDPLRDNGPLREGVEVSRERVEGACRRLDLDTTQATSTPSSGLSSTQARGGSLPSLPSVPMEQGAGGDDWDRAGADGRDYEDRAGADGRDYEDRAGADGRDYEDRAGGRDYEDRAGAGGRDYEDRAGADGRDYEDRAGVGGRDYEELREGAWAPSKEVLGGGSQEQEEEEKQEEEEEEEPDVYYFESDHLVLKHNKDYQRLLQTVGVLEAQRTQGILDLERLARQQREALQDPVSFVEQLQKQVELGMPRPQRVVQLPDISWDQYTSGLGDFEREFCDKKRKTRRLKLIFDKARLPDRPKSPLDPKDKEGESSTLYSALPSSDALENSSNSQMIRGRLCHQSKPDTFNQLWTVEEQKTLEQLLLKFPPEEVESKRWQKIADALGNRTAKQVASRVQKYFIKLTKAGIPVPGRTPNMCMYSKKVPGYSFT